ncbi:MAG: treZ, partial [Marmoricola sp.]|nr:treZ [Marmoricola sp.]
MRARFDLWAPRPQRVRLSVSSSAGDDILEMSRGADGWWTPVGPVPEGEVDYGYLVDDSDTALPDPRSRRQPHGVHERSRTFDAAAFTWSDERWTGRQLAGSVIYEL